MKIFIILFLFFLTIPSQIFACFSSGNPAKGNPETEKLTEKPTKTTKATTNQNKFNDKSENEVIPTEKVDQSFEVDKDFVLDYLKEFGHLPKETGAKEENITEELEYGIKHFQEFMNIPPKGIIDLPTLARMSWKRCGNLDKPINDPHIWEKTSLNWAINNYPNTGFPISLQQLRGLIKQAFSAWEIVIAIDFMEIEHINDANILFSFDEANENQSKTGLGIATGTAGPLSNIWLSKNQNWSIFQTQEETLIHEIGHSLGLEHIGDPNSVMFPMLERSPGEQLPVISSDDVTRLRALYETFLPAELDKTSQKYNSMATPRSLPSRPAGKDMAEVCPHTITAATNVLPGMVVAFNGQYTWTIKKGNITSGPTLIKDRFPDAPEFINASFSTSTITILIQGHTLRAKTYPKMLHNRILFYPTGAFPLLNESIILINGKVYATYNVIKNEPHMLGNLEELYPNLPDGLLSGIPATPDFSLYYMLTANLCKSYILNLNLKFKAFVYNTQTFRLVSTQTIGQFIECEKTGVNLLLQQFNSFNAPIPTQFRNEFPQHHNSPRLTINNNLPLGMRFV
ncbi:unnamed protein product [Meloidogyne enterolobii]|uniref:Uncharacterized protein n=1 Tax=Meloidogyne enterolobii TaxID=390850 RepID=A0ACB1ANG3_MELEN